jgi:opacity protein-like surface antigen
MSPRLYRASVAAVILAAHTAAAQAPVPAPPLAQIKDDKQDEDTLDSGVLGVLRIDGKGRGFAVGAGLAISRGSLEVEIMMLKSDEIGGYLGLRYWLPIGVVRPYVASGAPGFVFDHEDAGTGAPPMTSRRLALGVRVAAGVEVKINDHLSVQGDLGYEHFFFLDDHFEADVFVPTLGVIGRL